MTATHLSEQAVKDKLVEFIRETFLSGDPDRELDEDTPLLEYGVLDSMRIVVLLRFISREMSTDIPMTQISGANFLNIRRIATLIVN
ncbi:ACP domain-containing protein [Streptomyces sp. URMC 129]|uniref:ACP domain-containing protein n=1 Tax=Streptomyces sp. URMC 129 TaxID=3423407 RepID=UPI003F1A8E1F